MKPSALLALVVYLLATASTLADTPAGDINAIAGEETHPVVQLDRFAGVPRCFISLYPSIFISGTTEILTWNIFRRCLVQAREACDKDFLLIFMDICLFALAMYFSNAGKHIFDANRV